MAVEIVRQDQKDRSPARPASEWLRSEGEADEPGDGADNLGARHSAAALGVVAAAIVLLLAPPAVAALALFAPSVLDRPATWLVGASVAFSVVAAGRVPAVAIFALVMVSKRAGR